MAKAAKRTEAKSDTSTPHPTDAVDLILCDNKPAAQVVSHFLHKHVFACVVFFCSCTQIKSSAVLHNSSAINTDCHGVRHVKSHLKQFKRCRFNLAVVVDAAH